MNKISLNLKRIIGLIIGLTIVIVMVILPPIEGLSQQATIALGIFFCAVVFWVFDVLLDFATGLLMCAAWATTGTVPFNVAFAQFSSDTWFLLLAALCLGVGVSKSGLLSRISLMVMEKFPASFRGQTAALIVSGNIIGPMIPSVTAKCSIFGPFAKEISENMGYENDSKGAAGLFGAMFMGFGITGPAFLSSSFFCYTLLGLLPESVQTQMTWTTWAISALPWTLTIMILGYIAIQFLYKPENDTKLDPQYIRKCIASLGSLTKDEKMVSVVLGISLLLWITEKIHGISSANVAILATCALIGTGVMNRDDFRRGVSWDSVIFIGCIINIGTVFDRLGINEWIGTLIGPLMTVLLSNIWLYIFVGAILIYISRFFIVSMVATFSIFTIIITPFAVEAGINPWVTAFVLLASVNVFYMFYQNSTYLAGYYAADNMVSHKNMIKLSFAYMLISILGLFACVPLWRLMDYI